MTAGKSIAEPLERCGLFPPLLVQVIDERGFKRGEVLIPILRIEKGPGGKKNAPGLNLTMKLMPNCVAQSIEDVFPDRSYTFPKVSFGLFVSKRMNCSISIIVGSGAQAELYSTLPAITPFL